MTRIQIFCSEDAYPYEITGRKKENVAHSKIETEGMETCEHGSMTVADVLKNIDLLAIFLVENHDPTTTAQWMDYCYHEDRHRPLKNENFYSELFPSKEEEIKMCKRWLASPCNCDSMLKELNDRLDNLNCHGK